MSNPEKINDEMMEQVSGGTLTKEEALEKALAHARHPDSTRAAPA